MQTTRTNYLPKKTNCELQIQDGFFSEGCSMFSLVFLGINWIHNLFNFEDLIQKVNENIYSSYFYISDHLTQIHKAFFIYYMQFFQKLKVSTMCWCNSIFRKFQSFYLCLYLYIKMLRTV